MQNKLSSLSPSQQTALEFLLHWKKKLPLLKLSASNGMGRTTVLREFQRQTGAHWLDVSQFIREVGTGHPLGMQDAMYRVISRAVEKYSLVIIDDFELFFEYANSCSGSPRGSYHDSVFKALLLLIKQRGAQLVVGSTGEVSYTWSNTDWNTSIEDFTQRDYEHFYRIFLRHDVSQINFEEVFNFAPNLNATRIHRICEYFNATDSIDTAALIEFIQSQGMGSNVEVDEVQPVQLQDLLGVSDVVTALEDNIILPLENLALTKQLGLSPKRGVMLAGPPGTGKTTVGRALARRLCGKFFLIDGTIISGTEYFYHQVNHIFHRAMANSPSIVFIDDSDVIFESGKEHGLYRYLLTMLDGLESKSASSVCVIMTAMDLGNIPPALVRSGRIELWLEMKLPGGADRQALLERLMGSHVAVSQHEAWPEIIQATEGFSGADLKRLVQDGKLLMAADMTRGRTVGTFEDYLRRAAHNIHVSRSQYARSAQRALEVNSQRPRWFNIHPELFDTQT